MCGRYSLNLGREDLINFYEIGAEYAVSFSPVDEIYPSQMAPVIMEENGKRNLKKYKWGFNPGFTSDLLINARGETVDEKPTFRNSFFRQRCLIPATGFYEWKQGKKYRIRFKNKKLISLAGIFDFYPDKNGKETACFVIITGQARGRLKQVHHRTPVILNKKQALQWINPAEKVQNLQPLLNSHPSDEKLLINPEWD
ncbi:MAG: SOS response-associated peptidase [Halanaerobiaceae bacterium]